MSAVGAPVYRANPLISAIGCADPLVLCALNFRYWPDSDRLALEIRPGTSL